MGVTTNRPKNQARSGFCFRKHVAFVRSNPSYGPLKPGTHPNAVHMTVQTQNSHRHHIMACES